MVGMFQLENEVEYTRWKTLEHDQRGYDREDLIGKGDPGYEITAADVEFMRYPTQEYADWSVGIGLRGIYLSNYLDWDAHAQAKYLIEKRGFQFMRSRERTFLTYAKIDDHANPIHDYLKYLKFGYGRATDDASIEIRHGRLTRGQGMELVNRLDAETPRYWYQYLHQLGFEDLEAESRLLKAWGEMADGGHKALLERHALKPLHVLTRSTMDTLERQHPLYTTMFSHGAGDYEVL